MRNINKSQEPTSLIQHRSNSHADYDNYADKQDVREKLVEEQHGLCCYCMSRIRDKDKTTGVPISNKMKIEHCLCQDDYEERQLDYSNLLGACLGGEGKPYARQHCDTRKGNSEISFNPADPNSDIEQTIKFLGDGRIKSTNSALDREINDILNLNQSILMENRKAVLDGFKDSLKKKEAFTTSGELTKWDGSRGGILEPYSQVIVYFLKKKLSQSTSQQQATAARKPRKRRRITGV